LRSISPRPTQPAAQTENSRDHSLGSSRRKKEDDRLQQLAITLEAEQKEQEQNRRFVKAWMKKENSGWIAEVGQAH